QRLEEEKLNEFNFKDREDEIESLVLPHPDKKKEKTWIKYINKLEATDKGKAFKTYNGLREKVEWTGKSPLEDLLSKCEGIKDLPRALFDRIEGLKKGLDDSTMGYAGK